MTRISSSSSSSSSSQQARAQAQPRGALVQISGLNVHTLDERPLFRDLHLSISAGDRVAIIGRNGVGKSTLLHILSDRDESGYRARGQVVRATAPVLVPQDPARVDIVAVVRRLVERARDDHGLAASLERESVGLGLSASGDAARLESVLASARPSRGEVRKLHLLAARLREPALLLLDEPSQDLDQVGMRWLERTLASWPRAVLVVSHDRRLLRLFQHFFLVAESGARYLPGSFAEVRRTLERESDARQRAYARNLARLADREAHDERIERRRRRKKNVGRLHELRRRTSRARLNEKRGHAQKSQARAARIRQDRIGTVRTWARATRRALTVDLPLDLRVPRLPEPGDCGHMARDIVALARISAWVPCADDAGGARDTPDARIRPLFRDLDLRVRRDRVAVTGPNGAGKSTLLRIALGQAAGSFTGSVTHDLHRVGAIAQGATDWMTEESLLARLVAPPDHVPDLATDPMSPERAAQVLVAHRFPLALAQRPLASLSPGERVRAALICLFQRAPGVELLVLDEPTESLDFVGAAALARALAAWPGGLLVATHEPLFLEDIGITRQLVLDGRGGHALVEYPHQHSPRNG